MGIGYGWGVRILKIKLLRFIILELKLLNFGSYDVSVVGLMYVFLSYGIVYMISVFKGSEFMWLDL